MSGGGWGLSPGPRALRTERGQATAPTSPSCTDGSVLSSADDEGDAEDDEVNTYDEDYSYSYDRINALDDAAAGDAYEDDTDEGVASENGQVGGGGGWSAGSREARRRSMSHLCASARRCLQYRNTH